MIRNSNFIDRMFLSQGNEECIYIDDNRIKPTALEGVRFLFKQFKRVDIHLSFLLILMKVYLFGCLLINDASMTIIIFFLIMAVFNINIHK